MTEKEILEKLLEEKKITQDDINSLKQSPEIMMKLTALFHTLLCTKVHPDDCTFEEDHIQELAWESKSHVAWVDLTITLCQWINNGADFDVDEISDCLTLASTYMRGHAGPSARTVALLTLGLRCVADEEALASLYSDTAPQPSELDETES